MPQVLASTIFNLEEWRQPDGAGILEIRGGDLETALFVHGVPWMFDAADCSGSVGRFVALLPGADAVEVTEGVSQRAAQGFIGGGSLSSQVAPLLALLPRGDYLLTLEQLPGAYQCVDWDQYERGALGVVGAYYPYDDAYNITPMLCATQPMLGSTLDDATLNGYLACIEHAHRPALITMGARNHVARFVLDGHHKLFAYWCCGVVPHALHIEFQTLKPIAYQVAQQTLQSSDHYSATSYLRAKKPSPAAALWQRLNGSSEAS